VIALFNLAELLEAMPLGSGARLDEAMALFEEELWGQLARADLEEAADSARQLHRRLSHHEKMEQLQVLETLCVEHSLSLSSSSSISSDDEEGGGAVAGREED
jgi:hypothetical protein